MSLNYPMYRVHDGRRLMVGGSNATSISYTRGYPIFTGREFNHLLRYIKDVMGFHVYANSHFGGINLRAHGANSWHYVKDSVGQSLGADIGTYGDVNERARITRELIPLLDRIGVAWVYARDGHVANHYDHIHIDVGQYGNRGGTASNFYGSFRAVRKLNPITALPLAGTAVAKRKPKNIVGYVGAKGDLVRIIQGIVDVKADGIYGRGTEAAVKTLQRKVGVVADGRFGPATAAAYVATVGNRRKGNTGHSVKLIQWVAGITADGIFGANTEKAVKEMQSWAGLHADGIFGPASRQKIFI